MMNVMTAEECYVVTQLMFWRTFIYLFSVQVLLGGSTSAHLRLVRTQE